MTERELIEWQAGLLDAPRQNCPMIQYWPIEAVAKGPQPEAHKSIHDYRDQLAAKKKRRKGKL